MSVLDRFFVGKTVELAVIHEPKWAWLGLFGAPKTTALLAYKGILGQGSDLRFVVKNSASMAVSFAVSYDVYSEEGAMNLQIALGKYQMALEEFRARGTLDKRFIGVELGGFQRGLVEEKWMIAHRGKTLQFVVKRSGGCFPLYWSSSEIVYSEEEARNLQNALGKYRTALEWFRSTGEARGWL